jgi:ABC-2 type transport system permease protein
MHSLWIHIPFLICLVAGDVMAGEASAGTYRLLFTCPISRTQIIASKYIATLLYTFSLVLFLALLSILLGIFLLGSGDLLVFDNGLLILPLEELIFRFAIAFLLAAIAMCMVSSLAFLFSVLVENAIGPIIGAITIIMFFFIIGNLPYDFFISLKPYLFTNYLDVWTLMFYEPIEWDEILTHLSILVGYMFTFFAIAFLIFRKKDILS